MREGNAALAVRLHVAQPSAAPSKAAQANAE
jgi:hypothetical protein